MALPGVSGVYSAKDILGHLDAYERALVIWLTEARAGRAYVDTLVDQPDLDARNALVFQAHRDLPAQALRAAFMRTRDALEAAVAALDEAWLDDAAATDWFVVPRWGRSTPLWACILNDSVEHAQQHLPDLMDFAKGQAPAGLTHQDRTAHARGVPKSQAVGGSGCPSGA